MLARGVSQSGMNQPTVKVTVVNEDLKGRIG